jgi:hypothetical protein
MAMAATREAPAVLIVSASEVGIRSGSLLRHLAAGTVIRIDDLRLRETVGWLCAEPPPSVAGMTSLPEPGTASDAL